MELYAEINTYSVNWDKNDVTTSLILFLERIEITNSFHALLKRNEFSVIL